MLCYIYTFQSHFPLTPSLQELLTQASLENPHTEVRMHPPLLDSLINYSVIICQIKLTLVFMGPGWIILNRIPYLPHSAARDLKTKGDEIVNCISYLPPWSSKTPKSQTKYTVNYCVGCSNKTTQDYTAPSLLARNRTPTGKNVTNKQETEAQKDWTFPRGHPGNLSASGSLGHGCILTSSTTQLNT